MLFLEEEAQQHRAYSPTWLYFKHQTIKGTKTPLFEQSNGFYIAWPFLVLLRVCAW